MRILLCLLAVGLISIQDAYAQSGQEATSCLYEVCALRVEQSLLGTRLVAGEQGTTVGRLGLFGTDLSETVARSPLAFEHARSYERSRLPVMLADLAAGALFGAVITNTGSSEFQSGALVSGIGLTLVASTLSYRSQRSLSQAVWQYNSSAVNAR